MRSEARNHHPCPLCPSARPSRPLWPSVTALGAAHVLFPPCKPGPAHPICTLSVPPLISLPVCKNSSHSPSPFPCLSRRLAHSGRWRGAPALRTVALATPWVPSHVCGRSRHVICEEDAHALCLFALRARGAEQFACRVVHPCMLVPCLPVRASRCGCMLSLHICELMLDITSISYVN